VQIHCDDKHPRGCNGIVPLVGPDFEFHKYSGLGKKNKGGWLRYCRRCERAREADINNARVFGENCRRMVYDMLRDAQSHVDRENLWRLNQADLVIDPVYLPPLTVSLTLESVLQGLASVSREWCPVTGVQQIRFEADVCRLTGYPLNYDPNAESHAWNHPSLQRIYADGDYSEDNCAVWLWAWNIPGLKQLDGTSKQLDQDIMKDFLTRLFASIDFFLAGDLTDEEKSNITALTYRLLDPGSEERKHIKIIRSTMCSSDVKKKLYKDLEEAKSQNATEEEMALQYLQQCGRCDISLIPMDIADGFFAPSYERLAHRRPVAHTKINCVWIVRMLNSASGWNRQQLVQWVDSQTLMRSSDAQWTAIQEWGLEECHLRAMAEPLADGSDAADAFHAQYRV